jgi:high-affinity Fe2+/Pb2+ permease
MESIKLIIIIHAGRSASSIGAIVGGAVGGGFSLLLVIVLLLILILILIKVLVVRRGGYYTHNKYNLRATLLFSFFLGIKKKLVIQLVRGEVFINRIVLKCTRKNYPGIRMGSGVCAPFSVLIGKHQSVFSTTV